MRQRRANLEARPHGAVADQLVRSPGRNDDRVAGSQKPGVPGDVETHLTRDDLVALLLAGMEVLLGEEALGREGKLKEERLALRVWCRRLEGDPLAGDRVLDYLPCAGHVSDA